MSVDLIKINNTLKKNGKTFYFAKHFMGEKTGTAAALLYQFCRHVDDAVDKEPDSKKAKMRVKEILEALSGSNTSLHWVNDFLSMRDEWKIDNKLAIQLVNGVTRDIDGVNIQTVHDLIRYCYQVAGVVGEMMCPILRAEANSEPFAIDLGIAMQLTNIARDVYDDAQCGRLYLPTDWLPDFTPQRILKAKKQDIVLIHDCIERLLALSEEYYKSGFLGLNYLPTRNAKAIGIAAQCYRKIGLNIIKRNKKDWKEKVYVTFREKLFIALKQLLKKKSHSKPKHQSELHEALITVAT